MTRVILSNGMILEGNPVMGYPTEEHPAELDGPGWHEGINAMFGRWVGFEVVRVLSPADEAYTTWLAAR